MILVWLKILKLIFVAGLWKGLSTLKHILGCVLGLNRHCYQFQERLLRWGQYVSYVWDVQLRRIKWKWHLSRKLESVMALFSTSYRSWRSRLFPWSKWSLDRKVQCMLMETFVDGKICVEQNILWIHFNIAKRFWLKRDKGIPTHPIYILETFKWKCCNTSIWFFVLKHNF